jgi:hypothetical protein
VRAVALMLIGAPMLMLTGAAGAQEMPPGHADFLEGRRQTEEGRDGRAAFRRAMHALLAEARGHEASPERYLNLGNAALLADELPRSIWAFRMGLALAPQHARLRDHLQYARAEVSGPATARAAAEPDPWPWWLPRWTAAVWLVVLVVAYAAACAALAVWRVKRGRAVLMLAISCALVAGIGAFAWYVGLSERQRDRRNPVVIIAKDAIGLHTGNGPSYPRHAELPTLNAGAEARRLTERGGWLQLQFASGDIGWVRGEDVYIVE